MGNNKPTPSNSVEKLAQETVGQALPSNYVDVKNASQNYAYSFDTYSDFVKLELKIAFQSGSEWQKRHRTNAVIELIEARIEILKELIKAEHHKPNLKN